MEKKICVIAHDKKKPALVSFLKEREDWLWGRKIIATGMTAEFMEHEDIKVQVEHVHPGREGGFRELTEKVNQGEIGLVLFFRDPEIVQDYEADIIALVKACIKQNIPLASNPASAELLIIGMIRMEASRK
ncbi:MAG: methylglyoxal synthase [Flavobacteriales bacterium]|jgi:methylglyoxal synthase|nr:methylglyoxal synthase [Flavobacteriales bacterium]